MGSNSIKKLSTQNSKTTGTSLYRRKENYKFQMNPMKDVEGVVDTRCLTLKCMSAWAITPSKIILSKFPEPHAHLHVIGREST